MVTNPHFSFSKNLYRNELHHLRQARGRPNGRKWPPSPNVQPPLHKEQTRPKKKSLLQMHLLFLITLTLLLFVFYFYTVTSPQSPKYTIDDLQFKAFNSQPDFTIETQFLVTVKADNPNARIGFICGENSSVNVVHDGVDVCSGILPSFHQGPMNVTMMKVELTGQSEFGSGLQEAYLNNSRIPLLVMVTVPVRIVVGEYPLREFTAFVNCSLVVDNLGPDKKINTVSSNTTYGYEL